MAFLAAAGGSLLSSINSNDQIGDLLGNIPVVGDALGGVVDTSTGIINNLESTVLGGFGLGNKPNTTNEVEEIVVVVGIVLVGGVALYFILK